MENTMYGKRREGRWTPIRAKAQDTRANPNSWETHLVRKRWDIGLLRALSLWIMMVYDDINGRAANASDFIVKLPILRPSLRLYDFNVKSYDFYARQLSYYLRCINEWLLANIISMIFIRQYGANENDFHFCF